MKHCNLFNTKYIVLDNRTVRKRKLNSSFSYLDVIFTASLMVLLSFTSQAGIEAQTITFNGKNTDLSTAFKAIESQTDYVVFYNKKALDKANPVSVSVNKESLSKFLDKIFAMQPLEYHIEQKTIVVKEKEGVYDRIIQGRVTDENSQPIARASVVVKGTRHGTSTDENGYFRINIGDRENAFLIVSSVGFTSTTAAIGERPTINITLLHSISEEDEVVVTGYYSLPKERATGAFSYVSQQELEAINGTSLKDKLEGLVPGLLFAPNYNSDQDPTTERSSGLIVRGVTTLGDNSPLIVVDGYPVIAEGGVDPWATINPDDVESVTVLKDAAAASIWGNQAANGVIVITTKKAKSDRSVSSLNVTLDYISKPKPNLYEIPFALSAQAIDIYKYMFFETPHYDLITSAYNRTRFDFPEVIDILVQGKAGDITEEEMNNQLADLAKLDVRDEYSKLFLRKESSKKATISFSNSSSMNRFRASVMALKSDEYAVRNNSTQVMINLNNAFSPYKWLTLQVGANISVTGQKQNGADIRELQYIPQMSKILDDEGNYIPMVRQNREIYYTFPTEARQHWVDQYDLPYDWNWNLKREVDNNDIRTNTTNMRLNGGITIKPVDWLNIDLSYQYQNNNRLYKNYMNEDSWYVRNLVNDFYQPITELFPVPQGGMLYEQRSNFTSQDGRFQATANKRIKDHAIRALAGMEVRRDYRDVLPYGFYGYNPQSLTQITELNYRDNYMSLPHGPKGSGVGVNSKIPPIPTLRSTSIRMSGTENRFLSYYGNVGYTYKERYDLTGSIRMDKTNLYGRTASYRELPQWSVGLGYTISKESFFDVPFINLLRFRTAYGWNGHIDKSASPYIVGIPWVDPITQTPYASIQETPNPGLTWEKTANLNIGMDFAILDNRLRGMVEIYRKKSTDVLADFEINPTYGFYYDAATLNKGDINNRGVEFEIQADIINSRKFKWQSVFNYAHNKNKVVNVESPVFNISSLTNLSQFNPIAGQPTDYIAVAHFIGYNDQGLLEVTFEDPDLHEIDTLDITQIPFADEQIGNLFTFAGQRSPKHYGSWNNRFIYGNFELGVRLLYYFGHKFLGDVPPRNTLYYMQNYNSYFTWLPELMVDRWQSPDDNKTASMYGLDTKVINFSSATTVNDLLSEYNDRNLLDAGNIRLQNISLAYSLPSGFLGKTVKQTQLQLQARNLGPIYKANKKGLDPMFPKLSGSLYSAYYNTIRSRPDYSVTLRIGL